MIKITYNAEPFYSNVCVINEPCAKELTIAFDQDASSTEILNEIIRLLKYAGYSFIDKKSTLLDAIDTMCYDGVVEDDTKESQENE